MGAWISKILLALSGYLKTDNALRTVTPIPIPSTSCIAHQVDQAGSTAEMDPLVAAGFHNLTCSPLCRLPEELLLDIMGRLDLVSIQCLRRASRLFLRLYSSPIFRSTQQPERTVLDSFEHWDEPRDDLPDNHWSEELQILLDKDITNYCQDCQERQINQNHRWRRKHTTLTKDYLYCSGCHTEHPVCLFSKTQRSRCCRIRVCIGREGFIRVCEHLVITWEDVINTALKLSILNTDDYTTVFLKKCKHESHFPQHHKKDTPLLNSQSIYPAVQVRGGIHQHTELGLFWHGHLRLPDVDFDKEGYNKIATPRLLRQQLEEFRQKTPAKNIVPEFSPGRLIEMECFDPNRCSCLRYAGIEQLPKGWQLTHRDSEFRVACRKDPSNGLGPLRLYRQKSLQDEQEGLQEQKRIESHKVVLGTAGTFDYGSGIVWVNTEPCPTDKRCLQISYTRSICIIPKFRPNTDTIPWGWYQALDPDSYDLTDDEESRGILWCRQPGCENYYRYIRKAPFTLKAVNRECTEPCLR
jgi:hypothetical protein